MVDKPAVGLPVDDKTEPDKKGPDKKDPDKQAPVAPPQVDPKQDPPPDDPTPTPPPLDSPSKEEFETMKKEIEALKQTNIDSDKENDKIKREYAMKELKRVNPQLAKIHERSNTSTLEVVLSTAIDIKKGFPSLETQKGIEKKASIDDHDSMDYDFVTKDWTFQ